MRSLLVLLLALSIEICPNRVVGAPPNVVFILADDLGYADLACLRQQVLRNAEPRQIGQAGHSLHRCPYLRTQLPTDTCRADDRPIRSTHGHLHCGGD